MVTEDPNERPNISEVLQSLFLLKKLIIEDIFKNKTTEMEDKKQRQIEIEELEAELGIKIKPSDYD